MPKKSSRSRKSSGSKKRRSTRSAASSKSKRSKSSGGRRNKPSLDKWEEGCRKRGSDRRLYEAQRGVDGRRMWRAVSQIKKESSTVCGPAGCATTVVTRCGPGGCPTVVTRCSPSRMSRVSKCGPCEGDDIRPDCGPASNQMLIMQGDILVPVQRSKNDIRCQKRRECEKKRGAPSRNCVPQQNLRNMYEKYKKLFDCAYINLVDKRRCVAQKILARVRKEDKDYKNVDCLYVGKDVNGGLKEGLPKKNEPRMKMYIAEHNLYDNGMTTMDESLKAHGVFQAYLDYIRSDICEDTKSEKALYREYFTAWRADLNDLHVVSKCSNTLSLLLDDFMFDIDFLVERCGHKEAMKYLCNWDENSFNDMKTLKANITHSYEKLHTELVDKAADKTRLNFCSEDTCKGDLSILENGSTRMASPQPNRREADCKEARWTNSQIAGLTSADRKTFYNHVKNDRNNEAVKMIGMYSDDD